MNFWQSIILGVVQGLTEFLPVSSSGHLVITPYLFGWDLPPQDAFIFDVLVQVATLVAVFAYFWADFAAILRGVWLGLGERPLFQNPDSRLGLKIAVASLPAGIVGLLLKDAIAGAFNNPAVTGISLLVTALLLWAAERISARRRDMLQISWQDALLIGCFQALAVFPGISRSGSTIVGGMQRGLDRASAARFSFLMSAPIMLAAGGLAAVDLIQIPHLGQLLPAFVPGFIASAVVGYLSIRWLLAFLTHSSLKLFAVYCALAGGLVLLVGLLRV